MLKCKDVNILKVITVFYYINPLFINYKIRNSLKLQIWHETMKITAMQENLKKMNYIKFVSLLDENGDQFMLQWFNNSCAYSCLSTEFRRKSV